MNEDLQGRTALVTDASRGIGAGLASELARRGLSLVLVARRGAFLEKLAEEIREKYAVSVRIKPADLTSETARYLLFEELSESGATIDLLINNAGLGVYGPFVKTDWARLRQGLGLDIAAPTHLPQLLLPAMLQRRLWRTLPVASNAGFRA